MTAGLLAAPIILRHARSQEPAKLRMRLDWTPWGCHAAMHLAAANGWYRDAGLDVTIDDGNGANQTVQIVGGGDDVDVGHAALSSIMIARDKGFTLRGIACYARNSDIRVMVPTGSDIRAIKDLRGKRIGPTASSLETPFLGDFLKAGGLTKSDIERVNLDGAAKLAGTHPSSARHSPRPGTAPWRRPVEAPASSRRPIKAPRGGVYPRCGIAWGMIVFTIDASSAS